MLLTTTTEIKDLEGQPIVDSKDNSHLMVRDVIIKGLLQQNEPEKDPVENLKIYELALKIKNNDEVELTSEEVVKIKERISKLFFPIVVGQMCLLLEGKETGL